MLAVGRAWILLLAPTAQELLQPHETSDPVAAHPETLQSQIRIDTQTTIRSPAPSMHTADLHEQFPVGLCTSTFRPRQLGIVAARRDRQYPAHAMNGKLLLLGLTMIAPSASPTAVTPNP